MSDSYLKVDDNIHKIRRVSVKDSSGNFRIAKNVYARVDVAGTLSWENVIQSRGFNNFFVRGSELVISSVTDFTSEEVITLNNINVDHIVFGLDYVYLNEKGVKTHRFDPLASAVEEDYRTSIIDVDTDYNGYVYFIDATSIEVVDESGAESPQTYNPSLNTGEEFTNFCVDENANCYLITTDERVIKFSTSLNQTDFAISPSSFFADHKPCVSKDYMYMTTTGNSILRVDISTGNSSSFSYFPSNAADQKVIVDDLDNYYFYEGTVLQKTQPQSSPEWEYDIGGSYTIIDYDVSFNRNVYVIAHDGTNWKQVKLDPNGNEILTQTGTHNTANYAVAVVPGKYGNGFWDEYIN